MKSSENLDEVLKRYPEYQSFIDSIEHGVDWIYSIVNDFSKEENINIVSHLADADGFGSQIVFQKGLERVLGFLGNTTKTVQSERIMSFSKDENSLSSLKGLQDNWFGEGGKWIISDLASFEPSDANKYLEDALVVDHHKPKEGLDSKFKIVNPHLQGIDGGKELSASMISTFIVNRLYERIEDDTQLDIENGVYKGNEVKTNLVSLRKDLDYISMFGIAGSKADMQEDTGLNRAAYEYFENRGVLKKIDSPFFGYYTKTSGKVFAQSGPTFNFKYQIPDINQLNGGFVNSFKEISDKRADLIVDIYNDFRYAFTKEAKGFCVNAHYLESLPDKEISRLNDKVSSLVGRPVVNITYEDEERILEVVDGFAKSGFEIFDDVKVMEKRVQAAEGLIRDLGHDPKNPLAYESSLNSSLISRFRDSTIAFGDREDLERNIDKLSQGQYVPINGKELANTSIPEIANLMTSMSKLRVGDIFLDAVDEVFRGQPGDNVSAVHSKWAEYKLYVHKGMSALEGEILSRKKLVELSKGVYFMNVDFLKPVGEDFEIDLRQMNGVFAGIACETNLLPSGKAIFLTGTTYSEDGKGFGKISGRATGSVRYDNIRIDKFMSYYGGGGHKAAAAVNTLPIKKLDDFIESIGKFDFYKGEF